MHAQCSEDMMPFVCELYVRAITAGMNELERLKDEDKQSEARQAEQTLASWFTQLGALLGGSARLKAECALTAFSVHPAHAMYERVRGTPPLAPPSDTLDLKPEGSSEFNSWANDSRSQSNLVKTSETLQLKQAPRQANVLSTAILTEGEALGLSVELGQDLVVLLAGPRVKTLLWDMDRELLLENCRAYMERTHAGTRALTTELKYLNLDPQAFQHLPEEEDDENDAYYGIEKGYEHLVQVEEPEEIWQNAFIDPELTESAPESEIESYQLPIKKKNRSLASSDEEDDPLSIISDAKKEKKRANREKSKEHRKKKSHKRDSSKDVSKERRKDKDKKLKKERKKNKSDQPAPDSLTSLLGMKVTEMPSQVQDGEKRVRKKKERRRDDVSSRVSVTDSDYDSQGKLSQVSDTNGPNILIGGPSVGELKSVIRKSEDTQNVMDGVSPAVRTVPVQRKPSITKAKKPAKITKPPSVKTTSDDSDTSRARSPYLTPNQLASRHVVSSKVRNSITKLLQFRRNKLKAPSVPKSQTPVQQSTSARTHSLIGMKIYNPEGPKIHMTQKQCQELEAMKNEVNNLLNVADPTKEYVPKIPYNEAKEADKLPSPQSVYNAEKQQDMRYIQHNSTQNVVQNSNTSRESHKALSDYMPNTHQKQSQYNNYMSNQQPRPTSVINSSYISPSKQVDRQYTSPHISPPKTPVNRLTTQPFHKSMQNLTNNDDLKYDESKKHISDFYYYSQYATSNSQHSPRAQNNACIKSPNVVQNQSPNFNSYSLQQHAAVIKAREDVIKFYHTVPEDYVQINQSRAPEVNTQVNQRLNNEVIRHGQEHTSSIMQDTRTENHGANDAKWLQTPNDSRLGHTSYTKTYASSHTGEPSVQCNFNASDNKLQCQVGRIVQNPVKTSPVVRDATPKQLNIKAQQQASKSGVDNNFTEFLKELQKTINAGVNSRADHSVPLNKEVKVSLVNTSASAKKKDLTPPSAKQLIQQKKTENAPNTFSRLSYMHKNKQSESKLKNHPVALSLELNKNNIEHKISKAKYIKNEVSISRVDKKNTIVNNVNMQTFPKPEQSSSYIQSDFPVLTSILDAKPLETCKRSSQASSTVTNPTSDNSVNREHADLLLLLRNQQTFIAPKAKTNLSRFDLGPASRIQPKVEKPQVPVATNRTYQRTNDKDITTSFLTGTKKNTDSEESEDNQQDWKSVMNALRAHTTAPLGPNALDMVLKKERKHSLSSSSSQTSCTKAVSSNPSQSKASDSKRREHHSSRSGSSSRKPPIEKQAEAPETPNENEAIKKTPELSKRTKVPDKHFTSNLPKQNDPFISGIRNSDYDLLEELMDDDLRQEIGELSSDEEYRAPAVSTKVKALCSNSKTNADACTKLVDIPKEKPRVVDSKTILSNIVSDLKRMETNCTRTAVNTSSQASYTNVITYNPAVSNTLNLPESRPTVLCSNTNDQHTPSNQTEPRHYIANIPSNTRMEPTNLIITSVPTQPMVLISQELVYNPYPTIQIRENQVNAGLCNITQNSFVAVNTAPNIAVYQTTQFAAPVINPVIIGNAMTTTTNVTGALPDGNQHVKHEEKPAGINKTNPVVDDKIKHDSDITVEKSINLDLALNKNNERKVLSQVQENHTNDVSDRDLRTQRLSVDRNPVKTKQDEERLKMKRQSLMNREVKHPRHPPIPLSYTPLGKKVNVNKLLHVTPKNGTIKSNHEIIPKIVVDKKDTLVTNVESPKSETNNENIENPDQKLSAKENNKVCRRILLRSSNALKKKLTPSKNVRNKVKLKVAELEAKVAGSSDHQKSNEKTTKDNITRKRISKRLMDKKVKDESTETNKSLSLDTSKNQEVCESGSKEIPGLELIDFENELSGSKILKAPTPPKTKNAQPDLDKNTEKNGEAQTVVENSLQQSNEKPSSLDIIKATPIQNTAVPTVLIEKLKDNLGEQLIIKSTSATTSSERTNVITIKNKNETVLSINTKEPSKQIRDKSDNTIVKTAVETKSICKPPSVPPLHIKLNSSGPVIINDKLKIKTKQPDPVVVGENKIKFKTTQHIPVVIDDNKLNVTKTDLEPVVVDDKKLKAKANLTEPVIVGDNKPKKKAQQPKSATTGDEKRNVNIIQTEPVTVDDNKIKAKVKPSEPVVVTDDKVKAKMKPTEPVLLDDNKIKIHVRQSKPDIIDSNKLKTNDTQSNPVILGDDKLKAAKKHVPVVVDDNQIKATENQCSLDVVDDKQALAENNNRDKQGAPVAIVKNNHSIINNKSSKDETSEPSKNIIENLDKTKILPTKEISKNKNETVPLAEITCDKAVATVTTEVKNNNNRSYITVKENSNFMEQKLTDVHSTKINDTISIVKNPEQLKKVESNQTPTVSDLINNGNSVNENLVFHEKNVFSKNDNSNQKAANSLKDKSNNGQSNMAEFGKEDYIIEEIPIENNDDPNKKCVRIKLPNGKVFKATVFGKKQIDYDTLFADPAMKNVLTQSLSEGKRYTLNIKQVSTTPKNNPNKLLGIRIHGIDVIEKKKDDTPIDTVNLISDDEDDDTRSFSTEFGKYNTKINIATFTKHQKKFVQKCTVKLSRDNIFKSNRTKPKPRSLPLTANSLLTRTKSKLLLQEQNKSSLVGDVPSSNTIENATAVNLESNEQPTNTQGTDVLLARTKSKLLSKEQNLNCIVPDIQPSLISTKEILPTVNFKAIEHPNEQFLPIPLILKRVTLDRTVLNNSEVIEIDDSSNDSFEIRTKENAEPVKKIIEFKSLLLQDLGVAVNENVPIKENTVIPDNIVAVQNLKNALLKDLGVAETKQLQDVVAEQKVGSKDDPIKTTVLLMKECLVKVSKCDDLVKKYALIKRAKECYVLLKRCDILPVKANLKLNENPKEKEADEVTVDCGEDFIDFDVEEDSISPKLSRCPSLSILNLWDDTICQPSTDAGYGRSSPVMEIFEVLASLYNKNIHDDISEKKVELLPITCCSEWLMTKVTYRIQEITGISQHQVRKVDEIINTCYYRPKVDEDNAVFIFKAPKLVTIALKCLDNPEVVNRLHVACEARRKSLKSPNNLKRKTETRDDKVSSKIPKLETLALKAINSYDGDFFGAKIAISEEINMSLDVTQNLTDVRINGTSEFITEANKSTEETQHKNENSPSAEVRHNSQDEDNGSSLSTLELKPITNSTEDRAEHNEKMASEDILETKLSEATFVGQTSVSEANDSNVSLEVAASTEEAENEIFTKEFKEQSNTDNYEIKIQSEKTIKDLNIKLTHENYSKTYSDLENKLVSNDASLIHKHCIEKTGDACNEIYIESIDPTRPKSSLARSKSANVLSTSMTDPSVEADPIEHTDTEIKSTVEDIINCLLQRCEEIVNGVCQFAEKQGGIIASDTDKHLSHDMASDVLKDIIASSVLIDNSKLGIIKSNAAGFENSLPCEDNIEKESTNKDFETNSNIIQEISIEKNQPDDSPVLISQSSKKGDSELLKFESKQAVTEIHYCKLETEEKIDQNYSNVNLIPINTLLCEISADDIPKEGCEVEIVDTSSEEDTDIVQNTNEVSSCEFTTESDVSPIGSPLVVDNKEIFFNYHDYTKPSKRKENPIVNNEERDNHSKLDQDSQVLTDDDTLKVSEANTSICDQLKNSNSPKIKAEVNVDKEESSSNDDTNVASSHIKSKPELKYEFIQEDDWLTVITTENETNTTVSETDVTSSNLEVSKEDPEIVSPVSTEGSGVTLKGIEYEDPIMGKCYVFTLNESGSSTSNISSDNLEVFQESDSSQDTNEFKDLAEDLHNIEFCVIIPKVTYSKGSLKRKKNMRDFNVLESKYRKCNDRDRRIIEKRYRKGKNIDCPIQTSKNIIDAAYAKEFNRMLEYYSSLNFSFARPFPREYIDTSDMISNWPVSGTCTEIPTNGADENLFVDLQPTPYYQPDPATQTLAEEITYQYEKTDAHQDNKSNEAFDTNFNMGFGEGSGRVIQNLKKGGVSNISAATLSDVKQSQPFLVSEDYDDYKTLKTNTDDQLKKIRQYVNFIELRDKVRSFFKKTTVELKSDWIQQNKSKHSDKLLKDFPFDLCSLEHVRPAPSEIVVQVVQVGQLPVSAAAQNPVTCDPRVTQVSDASPSQCSVDNSPNDDSQSEIKTEYTELTTADLTLPLVQEYAQQNQVMNQDSHDANDIEITEQTISLEMEIKAEERPEIKQEMPDCEERSNSADNSDVHTYTNTTPEHIEYSFENHTEKSDGNNVNYDAAEKNSSEAFTQQRQQNGTSEKTDQIAHAMNAAGITTTPESINNSRAHALVNILSQKIRQGSVNTTQATTNTYSKTTSINAMSLQQALAQILPPPLNQTGSGENNQTGSTPVGPQVLHIVQGKNASGNQITLVDNSQQSVISNPNATQVLHIVQNKGSSGQTSNGTLTSQSNSFSGLSLVDTGLQQGGNQLLHIVNTGNQKNASPGQLLKRVNLLTNLANVQGSNEQKMVQFVCKSADGKAIQLNAPHQRSMVLRLQPIETPNVQTPPAKPTESQDLSPSPTSSASSKEAASQQEIKSRSIYEENYAKFIQNSSSKTPSIEKSTSLPKFNQAFGKPVFQEGNQKQGESASSNTHIQPVSTNNETTECHATDNAINLEHIGQISSPPLLLRKQPAVTSQSPSNLVQQIKQTISPMNIQTMHGGVIYTRQIPVNIGGGQTINLITVPSTELINEDTPKPQTTNQGEVEPSIIKIVPQSQTIANSEGSQEDNNSHMNSSNENAQNPQPQPVLTQMRIKLPMLSKAPQMVPGARVVRPSFFQIQRNVIGGANQPVYQQLVLTAAPPLGQQTIRLPQAQASRPIKVTSESQSSSSESQMCSSTLEQLREFDMVLEQVKERSTVQPSSNTNNNSFKLHTNSSDATEGTGSSNCSNESTQQQVLYSIGNNQSLNVAYVNRKATVTTPTTSTYVRSPDSTGIADSPTSSTHVQIAHTVTTDSSPTETSQPKPAKVGSKSKSRPKSSSNPPNTLKLNSSSVPPKTSSQKPLEDEQTTQRILYILAEYKEQVENSPDKDKPAPRRRSNPPSNPGSSKRKKSSSSRRSGTRDMSPVHGEDTCRTMGSEDSSCGTSQGDCTESCLDSHSPQDSPRKVARKITFDQELPAQARPQPQRNVIVADGQTITVARGTTGKPATAVLMPANYILPVSMVKGGQQIAIVTNRGPKLLTVGGEGGAANALLLQRLIGPGGLKPVLARPGVRHVRLPTAALHNLQAFNLATGAAASVQPPDSTASPTPGPTPPELVDTRATSSPWTDRDEVKPERGSSPEGSEPWNLPSSADAHEYSYEETVRTDNMDRTVLDPIPDRYSPDMEAQRIFDKMFDVDSKKSYAVDSHDDSPRCAYDIDASDCDDKAYQVVQKKDGTQRQHRLSHVSAAALRHKYAILEHELRLQKLEGRGYERVKLEGVSWEGFPGSGSEAQVAGAGRRLDAVGAPGPTSSSSPCRRGRAGASVPGSRAEGVGKSLSEECEDLGVDSPSASELFPEAELLFAASPAHDHNQDQHHSHTPQPLQSTIPQPDMDDQIATDHLIPREIDVSLGLSDVGIVAVSGDGMQATIALDQEEFARSHPNTTFHSEPTDAEVQPFTITGLKGRHITSTIFHSNSAPATVLMAAPQATVISQAPDSVKYEIENMINMPSSHNNDVNLSSVLVKDDGLTRFDNILTDSRELHLTNTTSAIVHSSGNATQVIRRVCYEDDKRERDTRFLIDEPDNLIAGDDAKMIAEDSSRDATLESMADVDDDRSSPERHAELFWESNSASERSESRRPLDFSSDSDKCCKSPSFDETNSTDSSGVGTHMRLDSVIKEARGRERSGSADGSSADDTHPPLRTYPPKRLYHPMEGEAERSLSGKTRAGERSPDSLEVRRRASGRGVVKRGCHCCNGSPAPPRPKKPRQRKPTLDFNATN
ncbi:hypothetical protein MSG28_011535 [Choristoneura fumiferana]|uniref:Uncharacterized protein n=1 Tax=Choristoneura fumiferana TaxID=7141 RepID=A0ACC0JNS5_CHOFU|nr:hypothetical protein MSG28_011535 [Choristoneura fumiferana]